MELCIHRVERGAKDTYANPHLVNPWGPQGFHVFIPSKYSWCRRKCCISLGFRTHYPKYGLGYILNWRSLRIWQRQEAHSDLFPTFLPRNRSKNPQVRGALPILKGEHQPCLQEHRDTEKNLDTQALLFPWVHCTDLILSITLIHNHPLFITPSTKHPGLTVPLSLHFLMKAPCHVKLILNKFAHFSPVNLSLSD